MRAEVVFEVPKGNYRAAWERRRARNKPDGALQPPKRYLHGSAGQVLAEKIGDAEARIEALVGLDYDRFLRSALLAQGEFSKFLKAKADERAALLESPTGTGIYSSLVALAYSTATRMEAELKAQEDRLQQVPGLPEAERGALSQSIESGKAELQKLETETENAARMLEKVAQLQTSRGRRGKSPCRPAGHRGGAHKSKGWPRAAETPPADGAVRRTPRAVGIRGSRIGRGFKKSGCSGGGTSGSAGGPRKSEPRPPSRIGGCARGILAQGRGSECSCRQTQANRRTTGECLEQNQKDAGLAGQVGDLAAAAKDLLEKADKETSELLAENVPEGEAAKNFRDPQAARRQTRDQLLQDQAKRGSHLEADTKNRKLREGMDRDLGRAGKALAVWQKPRELIGSHDGAKFRKYAQPISLDILTRHANRHLARLSGRYRIRRDERETLNLEMEDLDQAGARRPMAGLSGGKGFLASLALALGLSDLAGRSVRIDSLFVDEGFGTLDPEGLENATAALETLRQDHKTVGIISHEDLLKERISTQIAVEKQPGGTARIRVVS